MWTRQEKRTDACGVVVVGAGLTGAAVAARLARNGFDTAVLDAQTVAGGATGRSAGMAVAGLAGHYSWAVAAYGRSRARDAWALTVEGQMRLIESAKRLGVPVERTGSLALAVEEAEVEALAESAELLREDGFEAQLELTDPLDRGFLAALRQPGDVTLDAGALARALLDEGRVAVHEHTEVYSLEPEHDGVRVWAQGRTVLCDAAVLAIDGYAPLLDPYFADKVAPTRSLVFATDPLDGVTLKQPCSADYGYEYCRQLPDRRLLIGGWRRHASQPAETEAGDPVRDGLVRFVTRYFPEIETRDVDRWSGTLGFTPDGLPLVGWLPRLSRVYFAVGLGGRGLTWALVAADRLVELMVHDTDPGILSAGRLG
jgi:glycine/D-amino acid oxidase-like deaminating enzyme